MTGRPHIAEERETSLTEVIGGHWKVPLADGRQVRYVNLDNAASTPAFRSVSEYLRNYLPWYSSIHRGTGFKSRISTRLYDRAHDVVAEFVGADVDSNTVIFTKNATEAINKLSYRLQFPEDAVVLTTVMEHHSNDLPWRDKAGCIHVAVTEEGNVDLGDLREKLKRYRGKVGLVAVSGASNVTGLIQPVHRMAELVHEAGSRILVDAAQLAPHRPIDMLPDDDPRHIDFLVLSAHKMYAPFGTGALVGPREIFEKGAPEYRGGGTVESVTTEEVRWAGLPDREEAGSPNTVGAIALAVALKQLQNIGMDRIAAHEARLTSHALTRLGEIEGITIYGDTSADRVGVISFNLKDIPHARVAAVLSHEYGIGVRSGCFCAHPYVARLLGMTKEDIGSWKRRLEAGDKTEMPGMVRISFGCYNTTEEIDYAVRALRDISRRKTTYSYTACARTGEYEPDIDAGSVLGDFIGEAGLHFG